MQGMLVRPLGRQDPREKEIALGNPMDRGAWQATYAPRGCKRVRHDLATKKQQQQNTFLRHLKGQSCASLECTHQNWDVTARRCLVSTGPLHGRQRVTGFMFFPQTSILPNKGTQALTAFLFLFFTSLIIKLKCINTQAHFKLHLSFHSYISPPWSSSSPLLFFCDLKN